MGREGGRGKHWNVERGEEDHTLDPPSYALVPGKGANTAVLADTKPVKNPSHLAAALHKLRVGCLLAHHTLSKQSTPHA